MRMERVSLRSIFSLSVVAALLSLTFVGVVQAGTVSTVYFNVEVESALGSESWSIDSDQVDYDSETGTWNWSGSGISLGDVATLGQANLMIVGDPQIAMGFAITAGAADTTVTITSAVLSFDALNNPDGAATAGLTLTQTGGEPDAFLTGLAGDFGHAYAASYNVPPGVVFDEYVAGLTTTTTTSDNGNSGGLVGIPGLVSSMQSVFSFVLSAGDQASGTSNYLVIPEPASIALLAAAALFCTRRR